MTGDATTTGEAHPPRSLTDDLRSRSDTQLVELLGARPDLATPAPTDLATLAARATTPASVRRALDVLDTARLSALEAVVVAGGPATGAQVGASLGCTETEAEALLTDVHDLALVWRAGDGYRVPGTVRDALEPVAGLAPPHPRDRDVRAPDQDDDALTRVTTGAPPGAREVLTRLTWGPPSGTLDPDGPVGPAVAWLVDRGLLREEDSATGTVTLPRPVALALRGGRLHRHFSLEPPATEPGVHDLVRVDAGAGAQAGEVLSLVEEIAAAWGADPPRVLRSGGLAVRDLASTCELTGLDTHEAGTLIETLGAAGLIAEQTSLEPGWTPTSAYDSWLEQDDATRWAELGLAWLRMNRASCRIGSRREGATVNALSDVVGSPVAPVRRRTLRVLADVPAGTSLLADDVVGRLRWQLPRVDAAFLEETARATLAEAEWLGVTSAGALSSAGRALLAPDADAGSVAEQVVIPEPVDRIMLQADLTAVVPGRPDSRTGAFLRLAADVESRGGASTFRFSRESVQRLFDAGWNPDDVLGELDQLSLTGVPQPLEYLVTDAARGHGNARIGAATSYVRSDDVGALDTLLVRPEVASAGLRRLAPTVLVSPLSPTRLLDLLRRVGVHALVEGADGTVAPTATAPARSPMPRRLRRTPPAAPDLDAVVAGLRAAESRRAAAVAPGEAPVTDPAVTLAVLRQAASEGNDVRVGVVAADGGIERRHVRPTRVIGGLVHGVDLVTGRLQAWSISRITGASPA
ncbi:helicase-associated domain-containing protein [Mobilicoccus massiliensis]|uniref:helicase-associated domain-containing protein n=1 Tax=Mobilicoccus massiliensis TaxID=1522310 RepID=UPI0006931D0E|nr:helicase-associated domain-containing protein [Mobilicoccus massiliensis]